MQHSQACPRDGHVTYRHNPPAELPIFILHLFICLFVYFIYLFILISPCTYGFCFASSSTTTTNLHHQTCPCLRRVWPLRNST
ncbi:hypothetical protein I7I50_04804 [Histoplasma capsulatum G186AR]|uniref:Uncharacterized protein n=1 Tax=Ajellomyces capsulatus TaxID=5037 RepID=A0A8H7Y8V8_AJECA|nr:hypothetical protein I7I52_12702 [Histoplasma capsulatum]QSS75617.1 hypothetical protein I7I50_04804 [Histoplasma capsulatum G186AR]